MLSKVHLQHLCENIWTVVITLVGRDLFAIKLNLELVRKLYLNKTIQMKMYSSFLISFSWQVQQHNIRFDTLKFVINNVSQVAA